MGDEQKDNRMALDLLNRFSEYQTNSTTQPQSEAVNTKLQAAALNMLLQEIKNQPAGSFLSGELVETNGRDVKLLISNSLLLNAKLDGDLLLAKGDKITFEVSGNKSGQLSLRPLFANLGQEQTAAKALNLAEIPVNGKTLEMVNEMMKYQMPVNKSVLNEVFRQTNLFPEADVKDIVMLHKMEIPVTAESIKMMELYRDNNQQLMPDIDKMGDEIMKLILSTGSKDSINELQNFSDTLLHILQNTETDDVSAVMQNAEFDQLQKDSNIQQGITQEKQGVQEPVQNQDLAQHETSIAEKLKSEITELIKAEESPQKQTLHNHVKQDIVSLLKQEMLMEPQKLSEKDYVKKYYEKLTNQLSKLEGMMKEAGKADSPFAKSVSQMKSNVNFMNQINELYHFVQLPMKMNNQSAQGELYVYKRKHAKTGEDGRLTALLHLSMEHLGNMDVFLSLKDDKLNTKFCMEREELIDFMEEHMYLLNEKLSKKGYQLAISVTGKDKQEEDIISNIVNHGQNLTVFSKQSFDARA